MDLTVAVNVTACMEEYMGWYWSMSHLRLLLVLKKASNLRWRCFDDDDENIVHILEYFAFNVIVIWILDTKDIHNNITQSY